MKRHVLVGLACLTPIACGPLLPTETSATPPAADPEHDEYVAKERKRRADADAKLKKDTADQEEAERRADEAKQKAVAAKAKAHRDDCAATFAARHKAAKEAVADGRKDDARTAVVMAWADKNCSLVNTEATQVKKTGPGTVEIKKVGNAQDLKCKPAAGKPPELTTDWYHAHTPDLSGISFYDGEHHSENWQCRDADPVELEPKRSDKEANDKILDYAP